MNSKIPEEVSKVFNAFPSPAKKRLLEIRELIFQCAANDTTIGELTETLKWGEPAYLTEQTRSGSTIRLGATDHKPDCVAVYLNCQTTLIKDIQTRFPGKFESESNRVIYLPVNQKLPTKELTICLTMALKYHANKNLRKAGLM